MLFSSFINLGIDTSFFDGCKRNCFLRNHYTARETDCQQKQTKNTEKFLSLFDQKFLREQFDFSYMCFAKERIEKPRFLWYDEGEEASEVEPCQKVRP
jgi:hypothetical protein